MKLGLGKKSRDRAKALKRAWARDSPILGLLAARRG
jgi:hypothetical protein